MERVSRWGGKGRQGEKGGTELSAVAGGGGGSKRAMVRVGVEK